MSDDDVKIIYVERGDESRFAKSYIGDAVTASFDGWQVWLRTSDGIRTTNEIALEPGVYSSLLRYVARLYACFAFEPGERVRYVPLSAYGDRDHEDCEDGTVSRTNGEFVWVRFGTGEIGQACDPGNLVKLPEEPGSGEPR